LNNARGWRWRGLAAAAALLALGGCNQIAGIEEGELALCDDGQAAEEGRCPEPGDGDGNGAVGPGSGSSSSGGSGGGSGGGSSSSSSGGGGACPPSWTAAGGHCYLQEPSSPDWATARKRCVDLGGDLAAIHSPEQLAEIGGIVTTNAWIGGHDQLYEGTFEWSNGEPWDYAAWLGGAPDNHKTRDCVALAVSAGGLPAFVLRSCSDDLALLCERAP
jgi:hypothetical protein